MLTRPTTHNHLVERVQRLFGTAPTITDANLVLGNLAADAVPVVRDGCRIRLRVWPEPDGLEALLDKSLLRQEEGVDGEPRFVMLETIRRSNGLVPR